MTRVCGNCKYFKLTDFSFDAGPQTRRFAMPKIRYGDPDNWPLESLPYLESQTFYYGVTGECRYNAPVYASMDAETQWPRTNIADWCGQWEEGEKEHKAQEIILLGPLADREAQ
jgi:hypothetical protein